VTVRWLCDQTTNSLRTWFGGPSAVAAALAFATLLGRWRAFDEAAGLGGAHGEAGVERWRRELRKGHLATVRFDIPPGLVDPVGGLYLAQALE
jgi:hypothetical protein